MDERNRLGGLRGGGGIDDDDRGVAGGVDHGRGGADNLAYPGRRWLCGRGVEVNRHEAGPPVSRQLAAAARGQRALHHGDVRQQPQRPRETADRRGVGRAVQRRRRAQDDLGAIAPLGREPARQEVLGLLGRRAGEGEVVVEPAARPLREPDDRYHGEHPACQDPATVIVAPGGEAAEPTLGEPGGGRAGRAPGWFRRVPDCHARLPELRV